jgi:hypothetical protein
MYIYISCIHRCQFSTLAYQCAHISERDAQESGTPDVEILTRASNGVRSTGVAKSGASRRVIQCQERESHVLK